MSWIQKLVRWMTLGIMVGGLAWGQSTGQNVVNVRVLATTAVAAGYNYYTSGNLQNIGQSTHQIQVKMTGGTYDFYSVTAVMQGSPDGTNWVNLGPVTYYGAIGNSMAIPPQPYASPYIVRAVGYQSMPYLRTNVIVYWTNPVPLTVAIEYQGGSTPSIVQADLVGSTGGMATASITAGASALGTSYSIQNPLPTAQQVPTLYGYVLSAPSTITNASLFCASQGVIAETTLLAFITPSYTTTGVVVSSPPTMRSLGQCKAGEQIVLRVTGPALSFVGLTMYYRNE